MDDLSQTLWSIDRDYFEPSGEGIRGVRAVEHLLRHWEDCEQRDTPGNALWLHGQLLPLCEKKALFSHYLGDAAPLMAKASSRLFAMDTLDKINETWTTFLKILLKIAYTPHDYRPLLCAARELCENVLELERRFSSLVKQLYRELRA